MKILMLAGPERSGKTTTINMVYDYLMNRHAQPIIPRPISTKIQDFEAVLNCLNLKGEQKKVALASMGDYATDVIHYMSFYEGMGCDVLICACREYFSNPFKRLQIRYHNTNPPIRKIAANNIDNTNAMYAIIQQI